MYPVTRIAMVTKRAGLLAALFCAVAFIGCTASWTYKPLSEYATPATHSASADAQSCASCHMEQHQSWASTKHAHLQSMSTVTVEQFKQCGACHDAIEAHVADLNAPRPPSIARMSKTEQNELCGKCHFNKDILGDLAINPEGKHSPIMSVGFDEQKNKQISCLDCHSGHEGKGEMLQGMKAHVCFKCHKEAIVTMGIFQPFNYASFGKACQVCHVIHGGTTAQLAGRMAVGAVVCLPCHI